MEADDCPQNNVTKVRHKSHIFICLLVLFSACNRPTPRLSAESDTLCENSVYRESPKLKQHSGISRTMFEDNIIVEYSDGINWRSDDSSGDPIIIKNYDSGYEYLMLTHNGRLYAIRSAIGNGNSPTYWRGQRKACYIGKCEVGGVKGTAWMGSYPNSSTRHHACISDMGFLLEDKVGDKIISKQINFTPRSIHKNMFSPPSNAEIVTDKEWAEVLSR